MNPDRLRNRASTSHLAGQSTGSGGPRTPVRIDLASLWDQVVDLRLFIEARGDTGSVHAVWGVPGGWIVSLLVRLAGCGVTPARWFSQVDPAAPSLHPRYRWSARAMRWGGALAGVRLPAPRHVPIETPLPIARWMADVLRSGRIPHMWTYASSATRLCRAAADAGVDLRGARFSVSGEPATPARLAAVRRTGAEIVPRYGASDCGQIGFGCLAPAAVDEVHWLSDLHALIQPPETEPGSRLPGALLFMSSLRPTARLILLNASLGDQAVVTSRDCGCPFERLGWTLHAHTIRSDEKVTAAGMNFSDAELIRVLDEVLPARFGGEPTHYQLVEDEGPDGQPRLRLLVHPLVGASTTASWRRRSSTRSAGDRAWNGSWGSCGAERACCGSSGARRWQRAPGRFCTFTSTAARSTARPRSRSSDPEPTGASCGSARAPGAPAGSPGTARSRG